MCGGLTSTRWHAKSAHASQRSSRREPQPTIGEQLMNLNNALHLSAGLLFTAISLSAAPASQAGQCSQGSLAGRWGYTYTGAIILPSGAVPVASVGSFKQDAEGALSGSQTRTVAGTSGVEKIKGTISVNADCTGSATISVYDDVSGVLLRTAELALIYVDGEREVRLIFKSLVQSDGTNVAVVITANGKRISAEHED